MKALFSFYRYMYVEEYGSEVCWIFHLNIFWNHALSLLTKAQFIVHFEDVDIPVFYQTGNVQKFGLKYHIR